MRTLLGTRGFARGVAAGVGACGILAGALAPRIEPASGRGFAPAEARDLLLITLDTTRADHLSCYGYPRGTTPAIDRLARRGVIRTSVYAPIPLTNPSHSSLFTGLLPRQHGVRNNGTPLPDSVPTFVPDLANHGWNCAAFVSGIPLKAGLSGLWPGFSVYDDAFSPLERVHPMLTSLALVRVANRLLPGDLLERRARRTCEAAGRWLEDSEGPRFLWVHLFDPHTPYDAGPILRRRFSRECAGWSAHGRDVTGWPIADYDAELREADRGVDRLVRRFLEVCPDGVVVVTADHGEGLLQHGELTHGSRLYTEDLRVPLVVTGGEPGPGIVSGAELSITWLRSALPGWARLPGSAPGARPGGLLCETFAPEGKENRTAVLFRGRDGTLGKLVVNWDTGEELAFDLTADPGETRPLDPRDRRWDLHRRALPGDPASASPDLDPETVRRLRALGYIH